MVLSYDTWQRHYHSDPSIVGRSLRDSAWARCWRARPPMFLTVVGRAAAATSNSRPGTLDFVMPIDARSRRGVAARRDDRAAGARRVDRRGDSRKPMRWARRCVQPGPRSMPPWQDRASNIRAVRSGSSHRFVRRWASILAAVGGAAPDRLRERRQPAAARARAGIARSRCGSAVGARRACRCSGRFCVECASSRQQAVRSARCSAPAASSSSGGWPRSMRPASSG